MPYTKQEDRDVYAPWLDELIVDLEERQYPPGDVTYLVYKIVGHWFISKPKYQTICEIRGMLAGVLSEFDRRFGWAYENEKIFENGDVDFTLPESEEVGGCNSSCCDPEAIEREWEELEADNG